MTINGVQIDSLQTNHMIALVPGDIIECDSATQMVKIMGELDRHDIVNDFLFEHNGKPGHYLKIYDKDWYWKGGRDD